MRFRSLLAFAVLFFAGAAAQAQDAIVFSAGSSKWSAVGTVTGAGVTGGTPSADDNFTFASGADVEITGSVTLSTGTITVGPGARLRYGPGVTMIGGATVTVAGGEFDTDGAVLWDGRIQDITWGNFATGATVTLPQDVSGFVSAGDWLVYGDDNPEDGVISGGPVQTVCGTPRQDTFKPSYNRGAWYRVKAITGNAVTYDYDRWIAEGGTGTPYAGTRGPIAPADIAVSAITRTRFGQGSTLSVPTGTITRTGDGGSQYVEVTSGVCDGKMAKVLHTTDGGGSADTVHVAGDLSECGTPNVIIHYGARCGDRIKIVRPAVVSGLVSGANTTTIRWTSGKVRHRWTFFNRLGPTASSDITPTLSAACLFCIYAGSAGDVPSPGSYIKDSFFAHGELNGTSDTATIGISGNTSSAARYTNQTLDLTGIEFSNIAIADARETSTNNGVHGFIVSGVKNFNPRHLRIERMSDDAIAILNQNYTNDPAAVSYDVRDLLSYENFTNTASSQQCFEDAPGNIGTGTSHQVYLTRGRGALTDFVGIGCNENQMNIATHGNTFKRLVVGGGGISSTTGNTIIGYLGGYSNLPDYLADQNPDVVSDLVFLGYGTYTSNARLQAHASVRNSVVMYPTSGSNLYGVADARESFFDLNDTPAGAPYMILDLGNQQSQRTTLNYQDSVFLQSGADNFCTNFGNVAPLVSATVRRVFMGGDNAASTGFLYTCMGNPSIIATNGARLDGAYFTAETAGSYGLGASSGAFGAGRQLLNACMETSQARNVAGTCGTSPSANCLTYVDLFPKATQGGTLRGFIQRGIPGDVCDGAKPLAVGLSTLGVSHAALGDFFLDQIENFSSKDLLTPTRPWSSTEF